jgi:hypothetical protein
MITIAIADFNQTYCQGLKTMLDQVEGFEVVLLPPTDFITDNPDRMPIDLLLVDEDLFESGKTGSGKVGTRWPEKKTILLTMNCNGMATLSRNMESICKGAGKKEFVERIMNLTRSCTPSQVEMRDDRGAR